VNSFLKASETDGFYEAADSPAFNTITNKASRKEWNQQKKIPLTPH
jgi:hypothetical protein